MSTPHSIYSWLVAVGMLLVCSGYADAQVRVHPTTRPQQSHQKTTEVPPHKGSKHSGAVAQLLASNLMYKDTTLVTSFAKAVNASLRLDEYTEEDLLYPSIELYGEGSWSSNLNPFSGGVVAEIPARYEIDLKEFVYPLDGVQRVNSRFGYRRRFRRMHYGIDIDLNRGDTIRAAFSGRVRLVDVNRRGYGKYVVIRHPNGLETLYGHMSRHLTKENAIVRAGDPIGLGGSTGRSTGPHLHFETRFMGIALNPEHLIDFASGVPHQESYVYVKGRSTRGGSAQYRAGNAPTRDGTFATYRVRKGDTLSGIATKTGTTVSQIRKLNPNLRRTSMIRPGQIIRIGA